MKITKVSGRNVKGMDFDVTLGLVTLICGGNGLGKSAIPIAVRLALTGCLPPPKGKTETVKSAAGIYRMAGDPDNDGTMVVKASTDTDLRSVLRYKRQGGKMTTGGAVPAGMLTPGVLFDAGSFLSLTEEGRIGAVFAACDPSKITYGSATIKARMAEVNTRPAATCEATKGGIELLLDREFGADGVTLHGASNRVVDKLKELRKASDEEAKRNEGAFEAFRTGVQQAARPTDVTEALKDAQRKLDAVLATRVPDTSGLEAKFADLTAKINAIHEQQAKEHNGQPLSIWATSLELDLQQTTPPVVDEEIGMELEELNADYASIQSNIAEGQAQVRMLEKDAKAIEGLKCCDRCGNNVKDWQKRALKSITDRINKIGESLAKLTGEAADLHVGIQEREAKIQAQETALNEHRARVAGWTRDLEETKRRMGELQRLASEQREVMARLEDTEKPNPNTEAEIARLQAEVEGLQRKDGAFKQYQADLQRRDELEGKLLVAQCRAATYKGVVEIIVEEQAKATEAAFNDLLAGARAFTDGILPSPLEFRDGELGRRVAERDVSRGCKAPVGSWIPHYQLSDSEQKLTYVVFAAALARKSPIKLIILDELGTFADPSVVVRRMVDLQKSGVIDQAILVMAGALPVWADFIGVKEVGGFKVITF